MSQYCSKLLTLVASIKNYYKNFFLNCLKLHSWDVVVLLMFLNSPQTYLRESYMDYISTTCFHHRQIMKQIVIYCTSPPNQRSVEVKTR